MAEDCKNRDCKDSYMQNCHGVDSCGAAWGSSTLKLLGVGRSPPCGWCTHAQSSPVPGHSQILLVITLGQGAQHTGGEIVVPGRFQLMQ